MAMPESGIQVPSPQSLILPDRLLHFFGASHEAIGFVYERIHAGVFAFGDGRAACKDAGRQISARDLDIGVTDESGSCDGECRILGDRRFPIDLKVKDGLAFFDGDGFQPPDLDAGVEHGSPRRDALRIIKDSIDGEGGREEALHRMQKEGSDTDRKEEEKGDHADLGFFGHDGNPFWQNSQAGEGETLGRAGP